MYMTKFEGEISGYRIEKLLEQLQRNYGSACVMIDSPGGTFNFFSRLAPALARSGFVSIGERVASAAIVLQLLGRERLALPESTYFFHEVRTIFRPGLEVTICDVEHALEIEEEMARQSKRPQQEFLKQWHDQLRRGQEWMLDFMSKQTGLPSSLFLNLMRGNATLSAREAVQYGIVHRVISEEELIALYRR